MILLESTNIPPSIALYSALIGSASGILVSQVFDIIKLKKKHKLNLQKEFFSRKLDAFEKTVIFWTNVQNMLQGLEMTLKSIRNPDHYFDEQVTKKILDAITKDYTDINDKVKDIYSSLRLYIDIPKEYYFSHKVMEYFNLYGELGLLIESANKKEIQEKELRKELEKRIQKMDEISKIIDSKASEFINLLRY